MKKIFNHILIHLYKFNFKKEFISTAFGPNLDGPDFAPILYQATEKLFIFSTYVPKVKTGI